jgi:hypothetical protein
MQFTMKFLKELPLYETVQPYKLHDFSEINEEQQTNCVYEERQVLAQDLRGSKRQPKFEVEGFEFMDAPTCCILDPAVFETEGPQPDSVVEAYINETMNLVKKRLGVQFAVTIDWRVRDQINPCVFPA